MAEKHGGVPIHHQVNIICPGISVQNTQGKMGNHNQKATVYKACV